LYSCCSSEASQAERALSLRTASARTSRGMALKACACAGGQESSVYGGQPSEGKEGCQQATPHRWPGGCCSGRVQVSPHPPRLLCDFTANSSHTGTLT
jgi:hypothetical protein